MVLFPVRIARVGFAWSFCSAESAWLLGVPHVARQCFRPEVVRPSGVAVLEVRPMLIYPQLKDECLHEVLGPRHGRGLGDGELIGAVGLHILREGIFRHSIARDTARLAGAWSGDRGPLLHR